MRECDKGMWWRRKGRSAEAIARNFDTLADLPTDVTPPVHELDAEWLTLLLEKTQQHAAGSALVGVADYAHTKCGDDDDDDDWGPGIYLNDGQWIHVRSIPKGTMSGWVCDQRIPEIVAIRAMRTVGGTDGPWHTEVRCTILTLQPTYGVALDTNANRSAVRQWMEMMCLMQRNIPIVPLTMVSEHIQPPPLPIGDDESVRCDGSNMCIEHEPHDTPISPGNDVVRGGYRTIQPSAVPLVDDMGGSCGTFTEWAIQTAAAFRCGDIRLAVDGYIPSNSGLDARTGVSLMTTREWVARRKTVLEALVVLHGGLVQACAAIAFARHALTGATLGALVRLLARPELERALPGGLSGPGMAPLIVAMSIRFATVMANVSDQLGRSTPEEALALDELRVAFESRWSSVGTEAVGVQRCLIDAIVAWAISAVLGGKGRAATRDAWKAASYFVRAGRQLATEFYDLAHDASRAPPGAAVHDNMLSVRLAEVKRIRPTPNGPLRPMNGPNDRTAGTPSPSPVAFGMVPPNDLDRLGADTLLRVLDTVEHALRTGEHANRGWQAEHMRRDGDPDAMATEPMGPATRFASRPSQSLAGEHAATSKVPTPDTGVAGDATAYLLNVWNSAQSELNPYVSPRTDAHRAFIGSCLVVLRRAFVSGPTASFRATGIQLVAIAPSYDTGCATCHRDVCTMEAALPLHASRCDVCDHIRCALCTADREVSVERFICPRCVAKTTTEA